MIVVLRVNEEIFALTGDCRRAILFEMRFVVFERDMELDIDAFVEKYFWVAAETLSKSPLLSKEEIEDAVAGVLLNVYKCTSENGRKEQGEIFGMIRFECLKIIRAREAENENR